MSDNNKFEYLKRLSALQKRFADVKFHRTRALQATCFCLTLFSALLVLGFVILGVLYFKFAKLRCQNDLGFFKEVLATFPVQDMRSFYSLQSQSSGLFEFSEGQLKVNTTLYAW